MNENNALVIRSANRVNDTTFDRIWKFYYDKSDIQLKEKEEEIRRRLINIWSLLGDILTDRKAVLAHVKWCRDKGYKISEKYAYEDLRTAKMLFGDRRIQDKAAKRAIVSDWLIKGIKYAWDHKDMDNYQRLIRRYNVLNGLEGDKDQLPSDRPAIAVIFNADPETLKKQADEMRRKSLEANAQDAKVVQ